jgi:hypothetical protein
VRRRWPAAEAAGVIFGNILPFRTLDVEASKRQASDQIDLRHARMWMAASNTGTATRPAAAPYAHARPGRARGMIALQLCAGALASTLVLVPGYVAAAEKTAYLLQASGTLSAQQSVPAKTVPEAQTATVAPRQKADFGRERASPEARRIAGWIVDSADNQGLPFVVVDKVDARIFVFEPDGRIRGASPALLGSARGDDTVPGIGDRAYADMPPATRTTPAGRFVAALGMNTRGEDVLWVDYEAAVDIHRVITNNPRERRLARLATPTPLDNRISYGCINVPKRFYETVVAPAFAATHGIVYVLPEIRTALEFFGAYDVDERPAAPSARSTEARR